MRDQSISVTQSTVDAIFSAGDVLFRKHWDEVALNKRVMVLKPDIDRYRQLEAAGLMIVLAAHMAGECIGYAATFVMPHLHYADLIVANNDVLFVRAEYRASRVGLQLIRETERIAKERGAGLVMWHAKPGTALEALLPRLSYGVQDVIYSKEV